MKLALSALLVVLALSQTVEAKTKIPATETKATAEESRPLLDNRPTGGITSPDDAMAAPSGGNNSPYPPALDLHF